MTLTLVQRMQVWFRLHRRITLTVPVAIAVARQQLNFSLSREIVLGGRFKLTRRYWGHFSADQLTLYGPRAQKQFCFRTQGQLSASDLPDHTRIDLDIYLRTLDLYLLLVAIAVVTTVLLAIFRLGGLVLLPIFLGFFYLMVQWHFQYYATEITQLLKDLSTGVKVESP
ncbi:hypothetical protein [Leptolyngbya sp. PCC 6406]|uniref:hypothetical protein n=1 Tax=Leptolyngbya sp. PCC 6406 TaxID=1173264 RepID=UPI0004869AE6|nr:hypothetical protein [Leptolyngbya sp. PCC 6406]